MLSVSRLVFGIAWLPVGIEFVNSVRLLALCFPLLRLIARVCFGLVCRTYEFQLLLRLGSLTVLGFWREGLTLQMLDLFCSILGSILDSFQRHSRFQHVKLYVVTAGNVYRSKPWSKHVKSTKTRSQLWAEICLGDGS